MIIKKLGRNSDGGRAAADDNSAGPLERPKRNLFRTMVAATALLVANGLACGGRTTLALPQPDADQDNSGYDAGPDQPDADQEDQDTGPDQPDGDQEPISCFTPRDQMECDETVAGSVGFGADEEDLVVAGNVGVRVESNGSNEDGEYVDMVILDSACGVLEFERIYEESTVPVEVPNPDNLDETQRFRISVPEIDESGADLEITRACSPEEEEPQCPYPNPLVVNQCDVYWAAVLEAGQVLTLGGGYGVRFEGYLFDPAAEPFFIYTNVVSFLNDSCEVLQQDLFHMDEDDRGILMPHIMRVDVLDSFDPTAIISMRYYVSLWTGLTPPPEEYVPGEVVTGGTAGLRVYRSCEVCPVPTLLEPLACGEVQTRTLFPGNYLRGGLQFYAVEDGFAFRIEGVEATAEAGGGSLHIEHTLAFERVNGPADCETLERVHLVLSGVGGPSGHVFFPVPGDDSLQFLVNVVAEPALAELSMEGGRWTEISVEKICRP